ncbi:MAG TPA: universal stress protein [Acidimicrobiaceae bacterium]|nr:universal stress protein [Acidimicrobiaceae bacterium]
MFKKIVVGADDSPTAAAAVDTALDLAALCGAELHIVTAYKAEKAKPPPAGLPDEFPYSLSAHPADQLLEGLARKARAVNLDPVVHPATGEPADTLTSIAAREGADLIVVGNKGMKGVRRVLGSVPNDVAHRASCSVLIVDTTSD